MSGWDDLRPGTAPEALPSVALSFVSVTDLSTLDYEITGEVVDLEAKMSDAFTKVEIGG